MNIQFHKNFENKYKKLPSKLKLRIKEKNELFVNDPLNPILNNHALKGKYTGFRSINITGDIRAAYRLLDKDTALFLEIGSHSNLYK